MTFNISEANDQDQQFLRFKEAFKQQETSGAGRVWILKPGEESNRGNGIVVVSSVPEVVININQTKIQDG